MPFTPAQRYAHRTSIESRTRRAQMHGALKADAARQRERMLEAAARIDAAYRRERMLEAVARIDAAHAQFNAVNERLASINVDALIADAKERLAAPSVAPRIANDADDADDTDERANHEVDSDDETIWCDDCSDAPNGSCAYHLAKSNTNDANDSDTE